MIQGNGLGLVKYSNGRYEVRFLEALEATQLHKKRYREKFLETFEKFGL